MFSQNFVTIFLPALSLFFFFFLYISGLSDNINKQFRIGVKKNGEFAVSESYFFGLLWNKRGGRYNSISGTYMDGQNFKTLNEAENFVVKCIENHKTYLIVQANRKANKTSRLIKTIRA